MRSSYGLFGIVYEVTFRVKPLRSMAVRHKAYRLKAFDRELPGLKARGDSMMMYIYPFINKITVEVRRYRHVRPVPGNGDCETMPGECSVHMCLIWRRTIFQ
jgi:hypothetical protein